MLWCTGRTTQGMQRKLLLLLFTLVTVCEAEEMKLRQSWNYSRSVADLWAEVMCTSLDMPGPAWHLCSHLLCATFDFPRGHAGHTVTDSSTLAVFIWNILNSGGHCIFSCVFVFVVCATALNAMSLFEPVRIFSQCYVIFYQELTGYTRRSKDSVKG